MTKDGAKPMPTRRLLLASLTWVAAALGAPRARADAAATATGLINGLMRNLVEVVNGGQPREEKQAAIGKLVDADVDVAEVARFCLGRFWRTATPAQQREYVDLFHRTLVTSVTGKVGDYKGVTYTMGHAEPRDDTVDVPTIVTRSGNQPNKIEWIVSLATGAPKVVDVVTEGVSLRLTQRSDYASYLERNNNSVQALIDALRRQANNPQG
jgi:phospholipid transport system substrate-binding protein